MHTISYSYIINVGCSITISSNVNVLNCTEEPQDPCPYSLVFTTPELATEEIYQAFGTITTHTNYVVNVGSDITFKGHKAVTLNPNTTINYGSDFLITNENCRVSRVANSESVIEEKSRLDVYPNPTKGFVTISARDLKINKVMVTSMEGKIIHNRSNVNNYTYDLTLDNFHTGIYLVIVETADGEVIVEKIIKN